MKTETAAISLVLIALMTTVTVAREPTDTEAAYIALTNLAQDVQLGPVSDAYRLEVEAATGARLDTLQKLAAHYLKTEEQRAKWQTKQRAELCANRAQYEHDAEKLARYYDALFADTKARKRKAIADIPSVVGETDAVAHYLNVSDIAVAEAPMTPAQMLRAGASPASYLDLECRRAQP